MTSVDQQVEQEPLEGINNSNPQLTCGLGVGGNNSEPNKKDMSFKRDTFRCVMSGYEINKKKWAIVPSTIRDRCDGGEHFFECANPSKGFMNSLTSFDCRGRK